MLCFICLIVYLITYNTTDKYSGIQPESRSTIPLPIQRRQKDKSASAVPEKPVKFNMAEKLKISEKFSFRPRQKLDTAAPINTSIQPRPTDPLWPTNKLKSLGHKSDSDSGYGDLNAVGENKIKQVEHI